MDGTTMEMVLTFLAFPRCPAATEATMVVSTTWARAASFGLLLSTVVAARGFGACTTIIQKWAAAAAIRPTVARFAVSGISERSEIDYLTI